MKNIANRISSWSLHSEGEKSGMYEDTHCCCWIGEKSEIRVGPVKEENYSKNELLLGTICCMNWLVNKDL